MQILISSKVRKQKLFSSATIIIKYESFNKALFSAMKIAEALAEFEDSHAVENPPQQKQQQTKLLP